MRALPACELCGLPIEKAPRTVVAEAGEHGSPTGRHLGSFHRRCWQALRKKLRRRWLRPVNLAKRGDGRDLMLAGDFYVLADAS